MLHQVRKSVDITGNPELLRLVREMEHTQQPLSLRENDQEVAVLTPAKAAQRRRRKTGIVTKEDSLWDLVGMLKDDGGPTDVSANVDEYLAEAYSDTHP